MLETIREYALERLDRSGEADDVRARHAEHFAALADAAADEHALEEEHDNLRAAIDWSHDTGATDLELRLAAALAVFWSVRNHLHEGRQRVEAALRHAPDGPAPLRAKALGGGSWLAMRLGDYDRAAELGEESLALYRSLGDEAGIALALNRLGAAVSNLGDLDRAVSLQKESAAMYHELGDERGVAIVLSNLGYRLVIQGAYEEAKFLCDEALSLFRKLDERASMPLPADQPWSRGAHAGPARRGARVLPRGAAARARARVRRADRVLPGRAGGGTGRDRRPRAGGDGSRSC